MLTGYNTDITHQGKTYHIQTEDGGENNPFIVSLVYQGGRILASKKTSYAQIVGTEGFMSELRKILEDQHHAMIKAVKNGSLSATAGPPQGTSSPERSEGPSLPSGDRTAESVSPRELPSGTLPSPPEPALNAGPPGQKTPGPPPSGSGQASQSLAPKPGETFREKNLDQVILEYLASEVEEE
ncbi:MAG: hypothetical protein JSV26_09640 [bacterium]|nr:MAG: hypothetical protein JSV26_09640 [bacterium]